MAIWLFIKKWWVAVVAFIAGVLLFYAKQQRLAKEKAEQEKAWAEEQSRAAQSAKDVLTAQRAAERLAVDTHAATVYKAQIDADAKMAELEKKEDELPGPDASADEVAGAWNKRLTDVTK